MEYKQITLAEGRTSSSATYDVVVVIDVCRAFTTAAYALARGARRIILVSSVEEAISLRRQNPDWRLMGETEGLPVKSFDYWNSPSEIDKLNLSGVTLVQRTTAGTQGVTMWQNVTQHEPVIFAASFVVAGATVTAIRDLQPASVGFVVTGVRPSVCLGEEDVACADYMQALLEGKDVSPEPYLERAKTWNVHRLSLDPFRARQIQADFGLCMQVDTFDFPMPVSKMNGQMILEGLST